MFACCWLNIFVDNGFEMGSPFPKSDWRLWLKPSSPPMQCSSRLNLGGEGAWALLALPLVFRGHGGASAA